MHTELPTPPSSSRPTYASDAAIASFVRQALQEDWGTGPMAGDHSTLAIISGDKQGRARCIIKEEGVLAGMELVETLYKVACPNISYYPLLADGVQVHKGDIAFTIEGPVQDILSTERVVLNCLQRMSAIATKTRYLTSLISHTKCKLLDTRKTTPNFRLAEKWAVHIGGGVNHRYGLWDMVMLKDNHVDFAGGISNAVKQTQTYLDSKGLNLHIEVETRNMDEVREALSIAGVYRIMLDNMDLETMREAVQIIAGQCQVEASGGITETTIAAVAETGVDYISVGALTHHVKSMDISLKAY